MCLIPYLLISLSNTLFAKWLPPSLIMVLGVLNLLRIFLYKNPITVLASFLGHAAASTHFDT